MRLLVLAGGFGTRLKTAVPDVPKALAPVLGKPFLQFQIELWISQGIQKLYFFIALSGRSNNRLLRDSKKLKI